MPMGEGRRFQWWRLRWYWPDRKAAGKPYKMRLLYTGRTVMRMLDQIESLNRIIDTQQKKRTVDVSDVDGPLAGFEVLDHVGGPVIACVSCKQKVCDIDDTDQMDTLARACLDHEHEKGN